MRKYQSLTLCLLVVVAATLACTYGSDPEFESTVEALSVRVAGTVTSAAQEEEVTRRAPQTAEARVTATLQAIAATQASDAAVSDEAQQATATAAVPVIAALGTYGVDPDGGRVAWLHPPVALEVEGYQQFEVANEFMSVIAEDFVMSADITWNTEFGTSGCGFMLRADGDQNEPSQYMVVATRGGSGHVLLFTLLDGEPANGYDIYARGIDRSFEWQNDTTNRLAVVARDNIFTIYTNGVMIGEIDVTQPPQRPILPEPPSPPADQTDLEAVQRYQEQLAQHQEQITQMQSNYLSRLNTYEEIPLFERGFVAMTALSESGLTRCEFDDAWLWLIES